MVFQGHIQFGLQSIDQDLKCRIFHIQVHISDFSQKTKNQGTSLVAQWLRIRLPMQGTRVRALVREDPTCRGATKPVRHNY